MKIEPGFLFTDELDHIYNGDDVFNIMFLLYEMSPKTYMTIEYRHDYNDFFFDDYPESWFLEQL